MTPSEGGAGGLSEKVALSCNVVANEGHADVILGHVSALDPDSGNVFMKGAGYGLKR